MLLFVVTMFSQVAEHLISYPGFIWNWDWAFEQVLILGFSFFLCSGQFFWPPSKFSFGPEVCSCLRSSGHSIGLVQIILCYVPWSKSRDCCIAEVQNMFTFLFREEGNSCLPFVCPALWFQLSVFSTFLSCLWIGLHHIWLQPDWQVLHIVKAALVKREIPLASITGETVFGLKANPSL